MENFDLKKFLIENKLTTNSRMLSENSVEGIDLNLVKALQDEPAVQALHTKFKNNPELAKKAAKLVADIVDRKISENINKPTTKIKIPTNNKKDIEVPISNELPTPEHIKTAEKYGITPEEVRFGESIGITPPASGTGKTYLELIYKYNSKYNKKLTTGRYEKPTYETPKEDSRQVKKVKNVLGLAGLGSLLGFMMSAASAIATGGGPYSGQLGDVSDPQLIGSILISALVLGGLGVLGGGRRGDQVDENTTDLAGKVQDIINAGREL